MLPLQLLKAVIMARKSKRAALVLTPQQRATLKELAASRSAATREVERAKVMLGYADGVTVTELQRQLGFSRPMIYRCVDKALAAGVQMGLKDKYHRPHEPEIGDAAKAWVVSIACTKPKDHGLAAELWSISALARFVSERAEAAGFSRLAGAGKSTVWRILDDNDIKPHKIRYYLEKRDPDFDRKMQEVLMVYRDVSIYSQGAVHDARPNPIYTVSVDEKPGVQAIGLTAPDLPPLPGKAPATGRDYEYVRHGTVSILAGTRGTSSPTSRSATAASSSSRCSSNLTRITPPRPSSAWCWTTTRLTSPRKPWPISASVLGASSTFIRQSTALGST
jgi:predicted DNA-binding transcriptional regulator AlpA